MPPVVCIVGKNKKAKTKLMEALIKALKALDFKVGALKYHKHGDFEVDIEGKDTWKYTKAGADITAISSSVKFAVVEKLGSEMSIDEICGRCFSGCDIVLADGFTMSDKPRIIIADTDEEAEIFRRGCRVLAVLASSSESDGTILNLVTGLIKHK